jgi:hypothetical protein
VGGDPECAEVEVERPSADRAEAIGQVVGHELGPGARRRQVDGHVALEAGDARNGAVAAAEVEHLPAGCLLQQAWHEPCEPRGLEACAHRVVALLLVRLRARGRGPHGAAR